MKKKFENAEIELVEVVDSIVRTSLNGDFDLEDEELPN